jgi:molybdopterin converting factor small subunit
MSVFYLTVRLPEPLRGGGDPILPVETPVANLGELIPILEQRVAGFHGDDSLFNFAVNGVMLLQGERDHPLASGDEVEILVAFGGG